MPKLSLFVLSLCFAVMSGCSLLDRQTPPVVTEPPPYWQSQRQQTQAQLAEMRAFHDKESADMLEDLHIVRNREMERLSAAGKELGKGGNPQDDHEKIPERREKWTSWFTKKS